MGDTEHMETSEDINGKKSTCDIIQGSCCAKVKFSKITEYGEPGPRVY